MFLFAAHNPSMSKSQLYSQNQCNHRELVAMIVICRRLHKLSTWQLIFPILYLSQFQASRFLSPVAVDHIIYNSLEELARAGKPLMHKTVVSAPISSWIFNQKLHVTKKTMPIYDMVQGLQPNKKLP